jgi:hypothetical protein
MMSPCTNLRGYSAHNSLRRQQTFLTARSAEGGRNFRVFLRSASAGRKCAGGNNKKNCHLRREDLVYGLAARRLKSRS